MGPDRGHRRRMAVPAAVVSVVGAALMSLLLLVAPPPAAAQEPEPLPPGALGPDGVLTIAVREIKPFAYPTDRGWSGYSIDMWETTADDLDIPYEYVEVANVTEQLDSVTSGRTDAALGAISITAERSEVVEFTQPMFDSGLQIMVRAEDDDGLLGVMTALLSRTFLYVLLGLVLLLLIAGHVIWLVERRRNDHFPKPYLEGVWEGVWWAMVTMATVGYGDRVVTTRSGRVVAMLWMVIAVVLVAQFTALVTSTLTVNRITSDVENIGDLYGEEVVTVEGTSAQRYLADIDLEAQGLPDIDDAEQALLDGDADAVVYDSPVLRYFARTDGKDEVRVVGPIYQPQGYGMAFADGSPLVEQVDREFLLLREDGTTESLEDRYFGA